MLNTPHNPTGKVFKREELLEITKVLQKYPKARSGGGGGVGVMISGDNDDDDDDRSRGDSLSTAPDLPLLPFLPLLLPLLLGDGDV